MSESRRPSAPRSDSGAYLDSVSAMADNVMSNSQPTPTADEINRVANGEIVEIAPDQSPQMPPLHVQYAMLDANTPAPAAAAPAPAAASRPATAPVRT